MSGERPWPTPSPSTGATASVRHTPSASPVATCTTSCGDSTSRRTKGRPRRTSPYTCRCSNLHAKFSFPSLTKAGVGPGSWHVGCYTYTHPTYTLIPLPGTAPRAVAPPLPATHPRVAEKIGGKFSWPEFTAGNSVFPGGGISPVALDSHTVPARVETPSRATPPDPCFGCPAQARATLTAPRPQEGL